MAEDKPKEFVLTHTKQGEELTLDDNKVYSLTGKKKNYRTGEVTEVYLGRHEDLLSITVHEEGLAEHDRGGVK